MDTLILAGETTRSATFDACASHANVYNAYCPLHGAVFAAYGSLITQEGHSSLFNSSKAGRLWITGPGDYLCPIGAPGELLIEGTLLPRVCIDTAGASSVSVRDLSFMKEAGLDGTSRIYRTGDIFRQNHDGSLSYLMRKAEQIQVSNQSVDAGEIEYWVTKLLPDARMAVADTIHHDSNKDQDALIVVVSFDEDSLNHDNERLASGLLSPSPGLLSGSYEHHCSMQPDMVPSVYIPLKQIPVSNTSGKVD